MAHLLIFDTGAAFTDETGKACTLAEHLAYLRDHVGTPDCWDSMSDINAARRAADAQADATGRAFWIVSTRLNYRPVYQTRSPK